MLYIREADVLVTLARLDCFVHDLVGAETRLETAHTVLTSQHSYTKAISDTPTDQVPQGTFVHIDIGYTIVMIVKSLWCSMIYSNGSFLAMVTVELAHTPKSSLVEIPLHSCA